MKDVIQKSESRAADTAMSDSMSDISRAQFQELSKTPSNLLEKPNTAQQHLPDLQIDMGHNQRSPISENADSTAPQVSSNSETTGPRAINESQTSGPQTLKSF